MANWTKNGCSHERFKRFCNLPSIQGAINGTNFAIAKPIGPFRED